MWGRCGGWRGATEEDLVAANVELAGYAEGDGLHGAVEDVQVRVAHGTPEGRHDVGGDADGGDACGALHGPVHVEEHEQGAAGGGALQAVTTGGQGPQLRPWGLRVQQQPGGEGRGEEAVRDPLRGDPVAEAGARPRLLMCNADGGPCHQHGPDLNQRAGAGEAAGNRGQTKWAGLRKAPIVPL